MVQPLSLYGFLELEIRFTGWKIHLFFAFDVSFYDVLIGKHDGDSLIFNGVSSRGGHSTYRIIKIKKDIGSFLAYWSPLQKIGCTFEEGPNDLLSIDVLNRPGFLGGSQS